MRPYVSCAFGVAFGDEFRTLPIALSFLSFLSFLSLSCPRAGTVFSAVGALCIGLDFQSSKLCGKPDRLSKSTVRLTRHGSAEARDRSAGTRDRCAGTRDNSAGTRVRSAGTRARVDRDP